MVPPDLLARLDLFGVDVYHGGSQARPGDPPAQTMAAIEAWAARAGYEGLFGLGETGCHDADTWTEEWAYIETHPRWAVVSWFNSPLNTRAGSAWTLTGPRLAAFRESLTSDHVARL